VWTSVVLIAVYGISFLFVFQARRGVVGHAEEGEAEPGGSVKAALLVLIPSTLLIAWLSEILVGALGQATKSLGMTELFVGVVVVAIVGNAAEHATALRVARQNKMDLAMMISVGSSTQIALFVAPLLVFLSELIGKPMSLLFSGLEITGIVLSVLIVEMISADGETNWFEGAELLAVYVILGAAFYFLPG
jgi:Ca2+:H+ antiporter